MDRPIIIYTALFGDIQAPLREVKLPDPGCKFVCFTDRKDLKSKTWNIVHESELPKDYLYAARGNPRLKSKIIKIKIPNYRFFHNCSYYVWLDISFELKQSLRKLITDYMKNADIMAFAHPTNTNIKEEALSVSTLPGITPFKVSAEIAEYTQYGFDPEKQKKLTAGGFLFRKNIAEVDCFNSIWLSKVLKFTGRDQLSLDFCAWLYELSIQYLPGTYINNPWIKFHSYRKHA